jgi:hypothetical protein
MELLSLLRSRRGRDPRLAPRIEVAYDAAGNRGLAFNLAWRSIATGGGRQEALRVARASGATHALVRAGQVGMGVLAQRQRNGARLVPAALVAARQHSGTAVCCLEVTPGEFWLALTIHGTPTSTDQFLSGISAEEALQRAESILAGLDAQAGATLHTNIPGCTRLDARPYAPSDMLEAGAPEGDVLRTLPKARRMRGLLLGVVLAGAASLAWQQHRSQPDAARSARQAAALASSPDPQSAWEAAVMRWAAGVPMPGPGALQPVRDALGSLPVHWHGWQLAQAACRAAALEAGPPAHRPWHCDAGYQRGGAAHLNRDMAGRAPPGWSLRFQPLGELQLHRTVQAPAVALRPTELLPVSHYEVEVASRLQRLSPAFAGDLRLAFAPVSLPPPTDPTGQAVGAPARPVLPSLAEFQLRGPLRSIDAMLADGVAAHWHAIQLTYHAPAASGASHLHGGVAASDLMVELKGAFLAKP